MNGLYMSTSIMQRDMVTQEAHPMEIHCSKCMHWELWEKMPNTIPWASSATNVGMLTIMR